MREQGRKRSFARKERCPIVWSAVSVTNTATCHRCMHGNCAATRALKPMLRRFEAEETSCVKNVLCLTRS